MGMFIRQFVHRDTDLWLHMELFRWEENDPKDRKPVSHYAVRDKGSIPLRAVYRGTLFTT